MGSIAFEYSISQAIDIKVTKDELNHSVIEIQFKYVRFLLKLDDKIKTEKLLVLLGESFKRKEYYKEEVKIPKLYKTNR